MYESILTNGFRTSPGTCLSLVPSCPGYEGVSIQNQVCPAVGAVPGQSYIKANRYSEPRRACRLINPGAARVVAIASHCLWRFLAHHLPRPRRDQLRHDRGSSYCGAQARYELPETIASPLGEESGNGGGGASITATEADKESKE